MAPHAPGASRYPLDPSLARESSGPIERGGFHPKDRRRAPDSLSDLPRLASTEPRLGPELGGSQFREKPGVSRQRCVERIPCHPLFKDQHPCFVWRPRRGGVTASRGESSGFTPRDSLRPVTHRGSNGVFFRPRARADRPLALVTGRAGRIPRKELALPGRSRSLPRAPRERRTLPRSESLPSPGGPRTLRVRARAPNPHTNALDAGSLAATSVALS